MRKLRPQNHTVKELKLEFRSFSDSKPGSYPPHHSADVKALCGVLHRLRMENHCPWQVRKQKTKNAAIQIPSQSVILVCYTRICNNGFPGTEAQHSEDP